MKQSGMRMPQLKNKEIFGRILRSTMGVIRRRTSEAYANVIIGRVIEQLSEKYNFLKHVKIQGVKYNEVFDIVKIGDELESVNIKEIASASKDFMASIASSMGKNAGYYFIREIKEDLPFDYERTIRDLGVNLDLIQMDFITDIKKTFKYKINNSDVMKYTFTLLFDILDRDIGRDAAYKILSELVERLCIEHQVLKYVKVNDIRSIQGVDIVTINKDIDVVASKEVGSSIQKIIQEVNNSLDEKDGFTFIEKLKNYLSGDYNFKLEDMGVNLEVIKLNQSLVVKHVVKALIDILSETSTESYAILVVDNVLRRLDKEIEFLKYVNIDSLHYSEGINAVNVPDEIDSVSSSELGRSLQRIIEDISVTMGEKAGRNFLDKFKERLGKAYILRIEEMGVNLYMIELRQKIT
jgi:uncharacterized protein (UPF0297 family)